MAALLDIDIFTHYFRVRNVNPRAMAAVSNLARRYVQFGYKYNPRGGGYKQTALKAFAAATEDRSERRFHINSLKEFLEILKESYISEDQINKTEHPLIDPLPLNLKVKDGWDLREYQVAPHEYLTNPGNPIVDKYKAKGATDFTYINVGPTPLRIRFLSLPTGDGKTFTALKSIETINECTVIILKPAFMEKWVEDLHKTYSDITVDDIMVVSGADQLKALLELAVLKGTPDWKFTIISNKTYQNWLKLYEESKEGTLAAGYACLPEDLFSHLRAGVLLHDEVHMDFHLNYKTFLYTHVNRSIALSATLFSDDAFIRRMHETAFPKEQRYEGKLRKKHIEATAVKWRFHDPNGVESVNPKTGMYSHHLFEQSIQKKEGKVLANYLGLIRQRLKDRYFFRYKPGHKAIIYAASIDMCTLIANFIQEQYPDKKVGRYVEDDPYENLMESDIVVSTLGSAGTGMDIKGLTYVLLTVAVSSTVSNVQGYGRLREFPENHPDYDFPPMFDYFVCLDDPKHIEYAIKKEEILQGRALVHRSITMGEHV
jgi:hypothetical protein